MNEKIERKFKHCVNVSDLKATDIWFVWQDVANWPNWNKGLAQCSITGPFVEGQTFSLLPKGEQSNATPFTSTLTRVITNVAFDHITQVPWGTVNGSHYINEVNDGLEIYHEIIAEVHPDKIDFFDSIIAQKWKITLPAALEEILLIARKNNAKGN